MNPNPAPEATPRPRWRQGLVWAAGLLAGAAGLKLGWDFGMDVAGLWLALIAGLNSALFAALMAASLVGRLVEDRRPPEDGAA